MAIEALSGLGERVTLSIAGSADSEFAAALRRRAVELGVQNRVRWLGFLAGRDKDAFLAGLDLLIMPSEYECFGMAAAEAMIAGVPVAVSPNVGVADVVERYAAGLVVAAEIASIRNALEKASADRAALNKMRGQARLAALECFSFSAHGQALAMLYTQLSKAPSA